MICLAVSTEYQRVTNGRTDGHLATASHSKNEANDGRSGLRGKGRINPIYMHGRDKKRHVFYGADCI